MNADQPKPIEDVEPKGTTMQPADDVVLVDPAWADIRPNTDAAVIRSPETSEPPR